MHEHLKTEDDFFPRYTPEGLSPIRQPIRVWKTDRLSEADRLCIEEIIRNSPGITREAVDELVANALERSVRPARVPPSVPESAESPSPKESSCPPPPASIPAASVRTRSPGLDIPSSDQVDDTVRKIEARGSSELRDILERMVGALHPHAAKKKTYEEVRPWIWAINRVLTDRLEVPPCMRPQATPGRMVARAELTPAEKLMLNDRQIFDLEFAHRNRLGRPKRKWESLLSSDTFDSALAARFVATVGSYDKKIDALGLREDEQLLFVDFHGVLTQ